MTLELQDLSVDIAGRRIVAGIGFTVPDGSFTGLLGPNGSGKSTILKTIYRVHRPAAGRLLLDGKDLLSLRPRDAARRIAVVSQEFTLEFDFTVLEMVMVGRTPHKRSFDRDNEADRAIVETAIGQVGCGELADRSFNTLSGGEKQRVLIAQAIAMELVSALGVTVLAAIHDLSLAALFCDTVHLIAGGRIIAGGPPRSVITAEMMRQAYGTDVLVIEHPDTGTPHLIPRRLRNADPLSPEEIDPPVPDSGPAE